MYNELQLCCVDLITSVAFVHCYGYKYMLLYNECVIIHFWFVVQTCFLLLQLTSMSSIR